MTFPECLALCFATISSQSDSLISSPSFQDTVEKGVCVMQISYACCAVLDGILHGCFNGLLRNHAPNKNPGRRDFPLYGLDL
mgnify:CR=1 FL=1